MKAAQQQFNERLFKIKTHLALKACTKLILHGLHLGRSVVINKLFPSVEIFYCRITMLVCVVERKQKLYLWNLNKNNYIFGG